MTTLIVENAGESVTLSVTDSDGVTQLQINEPAESVTLNVSEMTGMQISTQPNNMLAIADDGLYVPAAEVPDLMAYYILAKA